MREKRKEPKSDVMRKLLESIFAMQTRVFWFLDSLYPKKEK